MSLNYLTRSLWNLIAPLDCAFCQQLLSEEASLAICDSCRQCIDPEGPRCRFCDVPLEGPKSIERCHHCHGERFRFERIVALGRYEAQLMRAVTQMKSPHHDRLAILLGDMLASRCGRALEDNLPDVVVPAPMIWGHRVLRGINSPDILATRIGRMLQIATVLEGLSWQRIVQRQSSLAPTFRRKNVRGALLASASYDFEKCHVLFVDDVLTTGATAHEAARALLRAGASQVSIAAVARGIGG